MMNIFRKLRWQLTLSYTLVTVCAFLVVILILGSILLPRLFIPDNILTPEGIIDVLRENSTRLWSHILSQSPVDINLVRLLLEDPSGTITSNDILRIGSLEFFVRTTAAMRAFVIGADGTLLGLSGHIDAPNLSVGHPFDPGVYQGLEAPFTAAMAGETDSKYLYSVFGEDKRFLLALPIFNEAEGKENQVVGVIVVVLESFPTQSDIPVHILNIAGRSLITFLLGIGIMGAIFGYIFANRLDARFARISTVTDLWSAGDFSRYIEDTIGDEITQFTQHLNNMAKQLQNLLLRRQEMAISEERNRLARDLHDSAKQQALAASFELGTALTLFDRDSEGAKKHLVEADALIDSVRTELTNLVDELRPQAIEGQEFTEILSEYVIEWSHRSGIEANIDSKGDEELPLETREILFRIAQEALANIARHSSASSAELSLEYGTNNVTMIIKDDGCGFDTSTAQNGVGLRSMRERAEAVNGIFNLESVVNRGTKISVRLPIKR
jgi:NarL family two-component system sensor histidine kinase LiaS